VLVLISLLGEKQASTYLRGLLASRNTNIYLISKVEEVVPRASTLAEVEDTL